MRMIAEEGPEAPAGCRDPRLWAVAAELLALHDAEDCEICLRGVPCSLVSSSLEAQDRAMRSFTVRSLGGNDDLLPRSVHRGRLVGGDASRQRSPLRVASWWRRWGRRA